MLSAPDHLSHLLLQAGEYKQCSVYLGLATCLGKLGGTEAQRAGLLTCYTSVGLSGPLLWVILLRLVGREGASKEQLLS